MECSLGTFFFLGIAISHVLHIKATRTLSRSTQGQVFAFLHGGTDSEPRIPGPSFSPTGPSGKMHGESVTMHGTRMAILPPDNGSAGELVIPDC